MPDVEDYAISFTPRTNADHRRCGTTCATRRCCVEVMQLGSAEDVLAGGRAVLADSAAGERALRFALTRAAESLEDVLRIAVSRGRRIEAAGEDGT